MQLKNMITTLVLTALIAIPAAAADTYAIDGAHSSVGFTVRHMVVSKVRGSFTEIKGSIQYDSEDVTKSSVSVTIPAESVNTANSDRDEHLRNADFFDVENHPELSFVSSSVSKKGDGFLLEGMLTMHGVSKPVEIPFQVNGPIQDPWGNTRMGIETEAITLDRRDFGLTWSKTLETGGLVVGDEITIEINLEAVMKK